MARNVVRCSMICNEFRHNFVVCNEIDQRDEAAVEKMRLDGAHERTTSDMIAHHLRHTKERSFERCGATCDQRRVRVLQQRKSSRRHQMNMRISLQIRYIFLRFDARSSGNHRLVCLWCDRLFDSVVGRGGRLGSRYTTASCGRFGLHLRKSLQHPRQVGSNFRAARTSKQCYNFALRIELMCCTEVCERMTVMLQEIINLCTRRIAHIVHFVAMFALEIVHFKG